MRVLFRLCFAFAVVLAGPAALAAGKPSAESQAKSVVLMDAASGMLLVARAPDAPFPPASLAKLMTLDVAFQRIADGKLSLDAEFPISLHAWRTGGGPAHVSAMFAAVKSSVAVRDLLRGIAVVVGNDAAIALAEGIAGSEPAFVTLMNARAKALGLGHTRFVNATGLPERGQETTARDLAVLARDLATRFPDLYKVFAEPSLDWNRIDQRNRNPLLTPRGGDQAYAGADGLLAGADAAFGGIIVASAARDGRRLIAVAAGLADLAKRGDAAAELLDRGFNGFGQRRLFTAGETIATARVFGGEARSVPLVAPQDVVVPVPKGEDAHLIAHVTYRGPVRAPFEKGAELATLKVWRDGLLEVDTPLVAADGVARGELWDRAFDATYELGLAAVQAVIGRLPL
ncbi:MAG TPA: D-alanyl-D-alanine carboxypeptidase family protein [Hyphomicrobiales bacterium]|nr:D-alanyl-D-alanine carboxypeptidase family protein [Hyphomicrobiales bacterium]